jgi:hypothetical protein
MLGPRQAFQILKEIIRRVLVYMVDMMAGGNRSIKLFPDKAM